MDASMYHLNALNAIFSYHMCLHIGAVTPKTFYLILMDHILQCLQLVDCLSKESSLLSGSNLASNLQIA